MDRLNAIRLLQALVAAGANFKTPMANRWIQKVALEIGLQDGELYSALAYAGTQDWLADSKKEGWTSLTTSQNPNNDLQRRVVATTVALSRSSLSLPAGMAANAAVPAIEN